MNGRSARWYMVWLVVGIVCFGLSLAGGYWYATEYSPQESNTKELTVDTSLLPAAQVAIPETEFEDISGMQTEKVQEVVDFLRTNYPAEADREVNKVALKRTEQVLGKAEYQLFQAADESDLKKVTMGCNWKKDGDEAVIEFYLDREFMKLAESQTELKDKTLRGVTFCVLSATTTPRFNEARQNEMLESLYDYLRERGWAIIQEE